MKIILITKRSAWEQYAQNQNVFGKLGKDAINRAKESHERQDLANKTLQELLTKFNIKPWLIHGAETAFDASNANLVITLGGDGTLLSASHNLGKETPLLGINSDPLFSVGHFCIKLEDLTEKFFKSALDKPKISKVSRMHVSVAGKTVSKRVLNEALFSHTCPAAMTKFTMNDNLFACSGVWVGTGAGSTGALLSAGGKIQSINSPKLQAVIREPFNLDKNISTNLFESELALTSKIGDATLYLDGPFLRIPVGFDQKVNFKISGDYLSLVKVN